MAASHTFGRALDTADGISAAQVERWRQMEAGQKAALVSGLSRVTRQLAEAGIAARYPAALPRERFLRLAILQLGRDLAIRVYSDAALLEP